MHYKYKSIVIGSLITLSVYANEDINKTKVFNDKYLNTQKIDRYKSSGKNCNVDFKISNIKNMTTISKEQNKTVSELFGKDIRKNNTNAQANTISDHVDSKSFKKDIIKNENYLLYDKKLNWQQHLGKYKTKSNKILKELKEKGAVAQSNSTNKYLSQNERIFIIISSSIPDNILKTYFASLERVNTDITFVLRGTIGGVKKIMPTIKWIEKALTKSDGTRYEHNIIIEPRIVSKYGIEKVPAVLYVQNYNPSYIKDDPSEKHWVHYGTVDPFYAIEKINRYVGSKGLVF